ncbi:MAG TPA: prolyl oligopeptidase family serine peptidase [Burkholderiales bacterium]|nr:prolyl oligopeptidase family serine peptidase [Burkholderiales bacterium]
MRREFIVLAPQLPRAGDLWHRYADDVRALVADVCAKQAVDAARLYLTGFSYGGNGVFDLGLAQPDLWAALWAVDPYARAVVRARARAR